jgi:MoaA/NifB/PqqE/SkfB family radical SAM enzyme
MYNKQIGLGHLEQRLYIHWDVTTMCEYNCSYCYAMKEYEKNWMRPGNWEKQKRVIDEISKSSLPVFLGLLGGEPTYHHKYWEMLELIDEKILSNHDDNRLYITTNGAKPSTFFEKHKENNNKIRFLWSFHPEFMTESAYNNFLNNIKIILKKGYKSRVNVMLHPAKKYWKITKDIINELKELNVELHPHFIYSTPHETVKYSKDFYEEFMFINDFLEKEYVFYKEDGTYERYNDIDVFNKKINKFKGWSCLNNNYEINLNCDVNRFCIESKHPLKDDFFKNIKKIEPIICPHNFCSCDGLLKIKKEK